MFDRIPLATVIAVFGGVAMVVAIALGESFELCVAAYGVLLFGSGKLGEARNGSGRGLRE